jgi:uncharacterized membrane protein YkoI
MRKQYLIAAVAAMTLAAGVPSCSPDTGSNKVIADKDERKDATEQKIKIEDVPPAVLQAVKETLPTGKITETETETKDGKKIYNFDVQVGSKVYDLDVSEDGKILHQAEDKDSKD